MSPSDFSDELLESMASASGQMPASQQLREAVLRRTTGVVCNRRRMRRAGIGAALIGCYLGGIATMSLWSSSHALDRFAPGSAVELAQNGEQATGTVVRKTVRPEDDQIADSSVPSAAARLTPYERLCRAGDLQLEKDDDIPAAIRSYKKALQMASVDQRSIAPDRDTWLLMALKHSTN